MQSDLKGFIVKDSGSNELITTFLQQNKILDIPNRDKQMVALAKAVAEIPWGMGRTIEEVLVSKGVGTCTGKHRVLQACFEMIHIPCQTVVCTFKWSEQAIDYPANLKKILTEGEEWKHGHNFVRVQRLDNEWLDLDVNWNSALAQVGFITVENWDGKSDLIAVKHVIDRWDGVKIGEMKVQLVESLSEEQRRRRKEFLNGLIEWTTTLR